MFLRKRREEKQRKRLAAEQAAEKARVDTVAGFREKLDTALKIPDPAERCLALMDLTAEAEKIHEACQALIASKAEEKKSLPSGGLAVAGGCLGLILGPFFFIPATAGYNWGLAIGEKRAVKERARLVVIDKTLLDGLTEVIAQADAASKAVLAHDPRELSMSPKADTLLRRVPKLKEDMLEAFRKTPTSQPSGQKPKTGGFRL